MFWKVLLTLSFLIISLVSYLKWRKKNIIRIDTAFLDLPYGFNCLTEVVKVNLSRQKLLVRQNASWLEIEDLKGKTVVIGYSTSDPDTKRLYIINNMIKKSKIYDIHKNVRMLYEHNSTLYLGKTSCECDIEFDYVGDAWGKVEFSDWSGNGLIDIDPRYIVGKVERVFGDWKIEKRK